MEENTASSQKSHKTVPHKNQEFEEVKIDLKMLRKVGLVFQNPKRDEKPTWLPQRFQGTHFIMLCAFYGAATLKQGKEGDAILLHRVINSKLLNFNQLSNSIKYFS